MRKHAVGIGLLVLVTGTLYIGLFQRDWVFAKYRKMRRESRGYTPARTPTEAVDKFRQAIKERDYETAAVYCGGDYAEQLRKASRAAEALGKSIDNFLANMETQNIKSDKARAVLRFIEPFPTTFRVLQVKQIGNDRSHVTLVEDSSDIQVNWGSQVWNLDPLMIRPLMNGISMRVELRREGEGDKEQWKLWFPVTPIQRLAVDRLNEKYRDYVRALDKVKFEVKNDPVTKDDVDRRLKTELEEAR